MAEFTWARDFVRYDDGWYFGNPQINAGARGFNIFEDGTWTTAFFKNKQITNSYIDGNSIGFFRNSSDYFDCQLDDYDTGTICMRIQSGSSNMFLRYYKTGGWELYDSIDNWSKCLFYSPNTGNVSFLRRGGVQKVILNIKPGRLEITGTIPMPKKVVLPRKIEQYYNNNYGLEKIYHDGSSADSSRCYLCMLKEYKTGHKWFGEAYGVTGKPGGFGIKQMQLKGSFSMEVSRFKSTEYGTPHEKSDAFVSIGMYRENDDSDKSYYIRDAHAAYKELYFHAVGSRIIFSWSNNDGDRLELDENFSSFKFRYSEESSYKTYYL